MLALLEEHLWNMHEITPPEFVFALDTSKLREPGVVVWSAWKDDVPPGARLTSAWGGCAGGSAERPAS